MIPLLIISANGIIMKQISFKQYRKIDITILCILTAVFEGIATFAAGYDMWAAQPLAVSITLTMVCIAMLRWGSLAVIPSLAGAITYCAVSGGTLKQYIIYISGGLFCLLAVPILNKLGKDNVRLDFFKRIVFILVVYASVGLGRWLVSLFFEFSLSSLIAFVLSPIELLSLLFAVIVVSLAKNADGLIEDQKSYLLRLEKEKQSDQDANTNDQF